MRTLVACMMLLAVALSARGAENQYVVALSEHDGLKLSDGADWTLEVGEVFPFIRWVSANEARGMAPDSSDRSYALVRMDDQTLLVPAKAVRFVEEKDIATAVMTYRNMVAEHRRIASSSSNAGGAVSSGPPLTRNDRIRMLYFLRDQRIIRSVRDGESLSDAELERLYNEAQANDRVRDLERKVRRMQEGY